MCTNISFFAVFLKVLLMFLIDVFFKSLFVLLVLTDEMMSLDAFEAGATLLTLNEVDDAANQADGDEHAAANDQRPLPALERRFRAGAVKRLKVALARALRLDAFAVFRAAGSACTVGGVPYGQLAVFNGFHANEPSALRCLRLWHQQCRLLLLRW